MNRSWVQGAERRLRRALLSAPWLRRRVPFIAQVTASDCGIACLAMTLRLHGKLVGLEDVRRIAASGRDGLDAHALLNAARAFGLRARGVRVSAESLQFVPSGSILHWEFNHFVVLEAVSRRRLHVVDPAVGPRAVPLEQARKSFTGVVLELLPSESFERGGEQASLFRPYLRQFFGEKSHWLRILALSGILQLLTLAIPGLTGLAVDRVIPNGDTRLFHAVAAGLLAVVAFEFLASFSRGHLLVHLRALLESRLTLGFLHHLVSLPYVFFQQRSAGDLMMRLSSNAILREIMTTGALSAVLDGTLVTIYLALIFAVSPKMGAVVVGLSLLHAMAFLMARGLQRELVAQETSAQARLRGFDVELFAGIESLKTLGSELRAAEHWSNLFVELMNASLRRGKLGATFDAAMSALRLGSPLAVLLVGTQEALAGRMTLGTMLALNALAIGALIPIAELVSTAMQFQVLRVYLDRIKDVWVCPPEQSRERAPRAHVVRGAIELDRVSFRYTSVGPWVVRDVSVRIEAGQCVAIVGHSGAGKSTLARLLVGLYSPEQGRILFDGVDLSELDLRTVRSQLGIVPQRPYLFGTTVRSNISLVDPAQPFEDVIRAAKLAGIHDEIMAMPMQYETMIGDGGSSLSGGQQQRLALARALSKSPRILLLDEATSAMDTVTERRVQDALATLDCTRIVIAHRLSTIRAADVILVMDQGRLIARGAHDELLAEGGKYAELVAAQLASTASASSAPAEAASTSSAPAEAASTSSAPAAAG